MFTGHKICVSSFSKILIQNTPLRNKYLITYGRDVGLHAKRQLFLPDFNQNCNIVGKY